MQKLLIFILMLLFFNSCVSIVKNTFGNTIIDKMYNPKLQEKKFYTEVPYDIIDGFFVIKLKISNESKEYNFIFDTGAKTYMSEELFNSLNILNSITHRSLDVNGVYVDGAIFKTDILINELLVKNLPLIATKSLLFDEGCKTKFDGILGSNILSQGYFYFNTAEKKLIITNQKIKLNFNAFDKPLKIKRKMGQLYIPIKVNNKKEYALLDTGYANGSILLKQKTKILKTQAPTKVKKNIQGGISSDAITLYNYYSFQDLKIGKSILKIPIIKSQSLIDYNIIGNKIIQENEVIIDVPNKKFYLKPNRQNDQEQKISNIGFAIIEKALLVSSLTVNSNIQKMGISVKDTIVAINNTDFTNITNYCTYETLIKNIVKKENFPLHIKIKKTDKIDEYTISLDDYYN